MIKIHQPAGKDIDISSDFYKDTAVGTSTDDFVLTVTYVLLYHLDYLKKATFTTAVPQLLQRPWELGNVGNIFVAHRRPVPHLSVLRHSMQSPQSSIRTRHKRK